MRKFFRRLRNDISYSEETSGSFFWTMKKIRDFIYGLFERINDYIYLMYQKNKDNEGDDK